MSKLIIIILSLIGGWVVLGAFDLFAKRVDIMGTSVTYGFIAITIVFMMAMRLKSDA